MRKAASTETLRHASEAEIMAFARTLPGASPRDFELPRLRQGRFSRGDFGCRIELIFGLDCGGSPDADFPTAQIELKSTKLERRGAIWEVGERTSIQMINYQHVADETWGTASVRKKLSSLLFCFYQWQRGASPDSWPIDTMHLWRPDEQQWAYLRADWATIHAKIAAGEAHLLSEADTRILGAATKAPNAAARRDQAAGGPPAKPRAFALKQPFVRAIYGFVKHRPERMESLMANLGIKAPASFEAALLQRYVPFVGRSIATVANATGVATSSAKNYAATVTRAAVKRLMGVADPRARIREFDEFGIEIKIVPVKANGSVKEAMSFPAFRYEDLADEEWETSDFRLQTDRLFIVPIHEPKTDAPVSEWTLGKPFFWSPTAEQERIMRSEWTRFRDLVASGHADALPTAADTEIVHVRPKARDSSDRNYAPQVGLLVNKCFWLNRGFVEELLALYAH